MDYESYKRQIVHAVEHMRLDDKKELLYIIVSLEGPAVVSETGTGSAIVLDNCKETTIEKLYNFITSKKV